MISQTYNAVYPGIYDPLPHMSRETVMGLCKTNKAKRRASVSEYPDYYKVQVSAPGRSREDFIVHIQSKKLSVMIVESPASSGNIPGLRSNCVLHTINLPSNTDTDFVHAEYSLGILSIYFQKDGDSCTVASHGIVVY